MSARWPSLLACVFLMLQIRFEQQALADRPSDQQPLSPQTSDADASAGPLPDAGPQHQLGQHETQQQPRHAKKLSCYVCTTMDYENPEDNACKDMIKYRPKMASYYSAPMMSFHQTTMQPPTAQAEGGADTMPSMEPLVSTAYSASHAGSYDDESTTTSAPMSQQDFEVSQLQAASKRHNTSGNYNNTLMTPNSDFQQQQQQAVTPVQANAGYYPQYRVPHPKDYTRLRTCSEEENFCSIVSVVNLEFHNDKLIPKFWAMERNCSKSCNNGCMVIGERVRLRVCSSCCMHPNCNYGSGASKALNISYTQRTYQFVAMLLVSLIMASLSARKSKHIMSNP